jgi:hypothetical protein
VNIPEPGYYKDKFRYDAEENIYVCTMCNKLTFRGVAEHHGRVMRLYKSEDCIGCHAKGECTRNNKGRLFIGGNTKMSSRR